MHVAVEGVQLVIEPRRLLKSIAKFLVLSSVMCGGGLEEVHLITEHDKDPAGSTFEANALLWFALWLVGAVVVCLIKLVFWLFRAQ